MRKIAFIVCGLILLSCSKEIIQHNLTVSAEPISGGTITPASSSFEHGTQVTLTATPKSEYIFKGWSGSLSGNVNPSTLVIDSDKQVTGIFEKRNYPLNLTIEGSGIVKEEVISVASQSQYPAGTSVRLTAEPALKWKFKAWSGDQSSSSNPLDLKVDKSISLKAIFELANVTLQTYTGTSYVYRHSDLWLDFYSLPKSNGIDIKDYYYGGGIAFADFDRDGYTDVLCSKQFGANNTPDVRRPLELYLNDGSNQKFVLNTSLIKNNIGTEAARQALVGDFNQDGKPDVFFADQGAEDGSKNFYNKAFPSLLLSNASGYDFKILTNLAKEYYHAAASADIDKDGDLDIFTTAVNGSILINDGKGNFTNRPDLFSYSRWGACAEFADLNKDGYVDLILGGHAMGHPTIDMKGNTIFWGNGVDYQESRSTTLPNVDNWGVSIDFAFQDLNQDGFSEIIVSRIGGKYVSASDSYENFYNGWRLQILERNGTNNYEDKTEAYIADYSGSEQWLQWLRVQDIDGNGKFDLFPSDKSRKRNNGSLFRWVWNGSKFVPKE